MLVLRSREKPPPNVLPRPTSALAAEIGRDERIRTSDPHTPSLKADVFAQVCACYRMRLKVRV